MSGEPNATNSESTTDASRQQTSTDFSSNESSGSDSEESTPKTTEERPDHSTDSSTPKESDRDIPRDVKSYDKFSKMDGAAYDRANEFLRSRTHITAREWAIARLCSDFRTETGVEMTKIGTNLPALVPFMNETYSPQAVNEARTSFEEKIRKAGATFLYGAMSDFFTAEELDDLMYEATEVAKFLHEVEGGQLTVDEEFDVEDKISESMRHVRESSAAIRNDEITCPDCGHTIHTENDN